MPAVAGSGSITVYETNSYTCSGDVSTLPVQVYAQPARKILLVMQLYVPTVPMRIALPTGLVRFTAGPYPVEQLL